MILIQFGSKVHNMVLMKNNRVYTKDWSHSKIT
jgi:hypothetical protein